MTRATAIGATGAASVLLLLGALIVRMWLGGAAHLAAARDADNVRLKRAELRRTLAFYFPGSPHAAAAAKALHHLAVTETKRDRDSGLQTWRDLRGCVLALRGLTQPYADHLRAANQAIATLATSPEHRAAYLKRLQTPQDPERSLALVGVLGLLGMFASIGVWLWRGHGVQLEPRAGQLLWLTTAVSCLIAFIVGMRFS